MILRKLLKTFAVTIHSVILLLLFSLMLAGVHFDPYWSEIYTATPTINYTIVENIKGLFFVFSGINLLLSAATYFYSKSFCIIHAVLCEFCLLTALATFFI